VILSGIHNHANGHYGHSHGTHKFEAFKSLAALTLPNRLRELGYRTACVEKYHVAPQAVFDFGEFIGGTGRDVVKMAEKSRDFITRDKQQPFFLYFAPNDPHRSSDYDETSPEHPNLFGNKPGKGSYPGTEEVFYDPKEITVPPFLPDTPETRAELARYYQSVSRIDTGVGRLIGILKEAGVYEDTLIVFTADHGMAFPGAKTTVYEAGLRVPFIVRNPYAEKQVESSEAMISHADITPSLLDFAGGLDRKKNAPKEPAPIPPAGAMDNKGPDFTKYHGRSWLGILGGENPDGWNRIEASHTFHEITMYYPMRTVREGNMKLIWNIAHGLPYPFASDLWAAPTWQSVFKKGPEALYGQRTVDSYIHRPEFELYDLDSDPYESRNLAASPDHRETLEIFKSTPGNSRNVPTTSGS